MLILYKSYGFKFSDIKFQFETTERYIGYYNKNQFDIAAVRITTSPDLYHLYMYSRTSDNRVFSKATEAEVEVYVNEFITKEKYVSIL